MRYWALESDSDAPVKGGVGRRPLRLTTAHEGSAADGIMVNHLTAGRMPTPQQRLVLGLLLAVMQASGRKTVRLPDLPVWKDALDCRTEDVVEIFEYLLESGSAMLDGIGLDCHLIDAIVQVSDRRAGTYRREDWV